MHYRARVGRAGLPSPSKTLLWRPGGHLSGRGCAVAVAQIFNLLYRRIAFGTARPDTRRGTIPYALRIENLRYRGAPWLLQLPHRLHKVMKLFVHLGAVAHGLANSVLEEFTKTAAEAMDRHFHGAFGSANCRPGEVSVPGLSDSSGWPPPRFRRCSRSRMSAKKCFTAPSKKERNRPRCGSTVAGGFGSSKEPGCSFVGTLPPNLFPYFSKKLCQLVLSLPIPSGGADQPAGNVSTIASCWHLELPQLTCCGGNRRL